MPESIIYSHASEDCPLCKLGKGKGKAKEDEKQRFRCHSMAVYASNDHNSMWVMRCEENYKKCPGYRYHERTMKAFKKALAKVSKKLTIGRVVALPRLLTVIEPPRVDVNNMAREQPDNSSISSGRLAEGCLAYYGFEKILKTKKNRKKKMWRITEEWYVRRN
jgi:hypothetical protein